MVYYGGLCVLLVWCGLGVCLIGTWLIVLIIDLCLLYNVFEVAGCLLASVEMWFGVLLCW